jgi:hypothetical protein
VQFIYRYTQQRKYVGWGGWKKKNKSLGKNQAIQNSITVKNYEKFIKQRRDQKVPKCHQLGPQNNFSSSKFLLTGNEAAVVWPNG